jgi:LPXTG-site transpeptidase (sortase) family protein
MCRPCERRSVTFLSPHYPESRETAGWPDTGTPSFAACATSARADRITVTTPRDVLEYVVQRTRVVDPADVGVLNPTPGQTLTLVTSYPFNYIGSAPKRFIVSAERAPDRRQ